MTSRGGAAGNRGDAADGRDSNRLAQSLSGTNLERAGDHNQRTVLQSIRLRGTTTRVELAHQTGLTQPTIANITNRLVDQGLVRNVGRTLGGRGQPALKLQVDPDGAFGIGLNIDRDHLTLVALDLAGTVRARIGREQDFPMPQDVLDFVQSSLPELMKQGSVDPKRVLGLGVAVPDDLGRIELPMRPVGYEQWSDLDLAEMLQGVAPWPVRCDNDAAAAALGEAQFATAIDNPTFFYLLISAGLGGGPVVDRAYHRGASARSGEIGLMPDRSAPYPGATVQDTVSLSCLRQRLAEAGVQLRDLDELFNGGEEVEALVDRWLQDATRSLTDPLAALGFLLNLDAIVIGGRLPLPLIERLSQSLSAAMAKLPLPLQPRIMPAAMAADAPAIGAAMLPFLDHVLPTGSILLQAGRG